MIWRVHEFQNARDLLRPYTCTHVIVITMNRTCRHCYHAMCRLVWFCCVDATYAFRICSASLLKTVRNHPQANPSFASPVFCWCGWPFLDTSQRQIKYPRHSQFLFSFAKFQSFKSKLRFVTWHFSLQKHFAVKVLVGQFFSWQIAAALRASNFFHPKKHLLVWKQCSTSYRCLWC